MTTIDFITALFYEIDEQIRAIPHTPRRTSGPVRWSPWGRCLTVRLPNPPVRTGYAAFTAQGSRNRDFMVTSISSGFRRVHGVQLARSLSTLYRFPTLFLRAFAMYVAFPHADYYALSDCLEGLGRFGAGLPCLLSTVLCIPCR